MSDYARVLIYDDKIGSLEFTCDLYDRKWKLDCGSSVGDLIVSDDDGRIALARTRTQEFLAAQHEYYSNEESA